MTLLCHGSNTILTAGTYLLPNVSFDLEPLVYATDDYVYAVVRCGNFETEDIAIKEDYSGKDAPYILVELRQNAFKDIFDTEGFIYFVDKEDFHKKNNIDYVTSNGVRIIDRLTIPNVWNELQKYPDRFRFVNFDNCDAYFNEIGVDKECYLKRRRDRIERIKQVIYL